MRSRETDMRSHETDMRPRPPPPAVPSRLQRASPLPAYPAFLTTRPGRPHPQIFDLKAGTWAPAGTAPDLPTPHAGALTIRRGAPRRRQRRPHRPHCRRGARLQVGTPAAAHGCGRPSPRRLCSRPSTCSQTWSPARPPATPTTRSMGRGEVVVDVPPDQTVATLRFLQTHSSALYAEPWVACDACLCSALLHPCSHEEHAAHPPLASVPCTPASRRRGRRGTPRRARPPAPAPSAAGRGPPAPPPETGGRSGPTASPPHAPRPPACRPCRGLPRRRPRRSPPTGYRPARLGAHPPRRPRRRRPPITLPPRRAPRQRRPRLATRPPTAPSAPPPTRRSPRGARRPPAATRRRCRRPGYWKPAAPHSGRARRARRRRPPRASSR